MKVLLVEDDDRIAGEISHALENAGYVVDRTADGQDAWFKGDVEDYDAVILDLGLPSMDGLSVLKHWRANDRTCPVLILTARGSWAERVDGIDAGADDYLPKPFEMPELLARLRAITRRATGRTQPVMTAGPVTLDPRTMKVTVDGRDPGLSAQEYRLLAYMMHHGGRVVSQSELIEHLYPGDSDTTENTIEVLIGRVRRKLGAGIIQTRRGFGYMIEGGAA